MSRVRLSDRARWGKDDKFKVTDEEKLQNPNKYFLFSRDESDLGKKGEMHKVIFFPILGYYSIIIYKIQLYATIGSGCRRHGDNCNGNDYI